MSIRYMAAVWYTDLPSNQRLVLLALADNARDDGLAWPSVARLAAKTGYSRRQVQRLLRDLENAGMISTTTPAGPRRTATYRLDYQAIHDRQNVPDLDDDPANAERDRPDQTPDEGRQDVTPGATPTSPQGRQDDAVGVTPVSPKPSENHQRTTSEPSAVPAVRDDAVVVEIPDDLAPGPIHVDPYKIAMVEIFGDVDPDNPDDSWSLRQRVIEKAKTSGGGPAEIAVRCGRLIEQWNAGALTVASLLKWWGRFGSPVGQITAADERRHADDVEADRIRQSILANADQIRAGDVDVAWSDDETP